jgi:hypothetical protein
MPFPLHHKKDFVELHAEGKEIKMKILRGRIAADYCWI